MNSLTTPSAKIIDVALASNAYPVYLGKGLLSEPSLWSRHLGTGKTLIVTNVVVAPLYLEQLKSALGERDIWTHVIADGEPQKTVDTWFGIIDKLVSMQARRDASVIALGGGVVGDIAGFAAACYMRGVRFLQAPTTLLAQVDASVGGKTAINHQKAKTWSVHFTNRLLSLLIPQPLRACPKESSMPVWPKSSSTVRSEMPDFSIGWRAIVHASPTGIKKALDHLIHESVQNKAEIVAADEKEAGVRALLNFGHSFGHALEATTDYSRFLHGEAVSIGMVTAAFLSESLGMCEHGAAARLAAILRSFGLPVQQPADIAIGELVDALALDKKAVVSGLRLILLKAIGNAVVDSSSQQADIIAAMESNLV